MIDFEFKSNKSKFYQRFHNNICKQYLINKLKSHKIVIQIKYYYK